MGGSSSIGRFGRKRTCASAQEVMLKFMVDQEKNEKELRSALCCATRITIPGVMEVPKQEYNQLYPVDFKSMPPLINDDKKLQEKCMKQELTTSKFPKLILQKLDINTFNLEKWMKQELTTSKFPKLILQKLDINTLTQVECKGQGPFP